MKVAVTLEADEFKARIAKLPDDKRKAIEVLVAKTAVDVHRNAVTSIQRGPNTGTVYQKYNPNRTHQASAPGEAPASDTGRLAGSIKYNLRGMYAEVGSNVNYAESLEFGTSRMLARPFLVPATEAERPAFRRGLVEALK